MAECDQHTVTRTRAGSFVALSCAIFNHLVDNNREGGREGGLDAGRRFSAVVFFPFFIMEVHKAAAAPQDEQTPSSAAGILPL